MRGKLLRVVAWLVTIGLLSYLFWRTPVEEVWAALHNAAWWAAPAVVLCSLLVYLADSLAIWKIFTWFVAPLRFREALVVRGATYFLGVVNYTLGQGAIVYFLHRNKQVPVRRAAAGVLFTMGINVIVLLALASGGLLAGAEVPAVLRTVVGTVWAALAFYVVLLVWRPPFLRGLPVVDLGVLFAAGLTGHLKALGARLPHVAALLLLSWLSLYAFGVKLPASAALFYLPVVYFVAVLPISIQGLGTSQLLMVQFFARFAADGERRGAVVLASSLTAQAIAVATQLLIGMACMRAREGRALGAQAPIPH